MREKFSRTLVDKTIVSFVKFDGKNPEVILEHTFDGYAKKSDIDEYQRNNPKLKGTTPVKKQEITAKYEYTADIVRQYGVKKEQEEK